MKILKYNLPNNVKTKTNANFLWLQHIASRFNNQRYSVCMLIDWEYCELNSKQQQFLSALYNIDFCYCSVPPLFNSYDILIIGSTNSTLIQSYIQLFAKTNGLVCLPENANYSATNQIVLTPRPGFKTHVKQTTELLKTLPIPNTNTMFYYTTIGGMQTLTLTSKQIKQNFSKLKKELLSLQNYKNNMADSEFI